MKIISKFKDYYDFVAGYDTDPRKVYNRQLLIDGQIEKPHPAVGGVIGNIEIRKIWRTFFKGEVWFCDIRYPYLYDVYLERYYWDYYKIPQVLREKLDGFIVNGNSFDLAGHWDIRKPEEWKRKWRKTAALTVRWRYTDRDKIKDLNTRRGAPILFTWLRDNMHKELVQNGPLLWVHFNQIKSPQEAFTDLYNWLPYNEPEMPHDPTDMSRFENKGFSKKTSFRGKQ